LQRLDGDLDGDSIVNNDRIRASNIVVLVRVLCGASGAS
jgi:hypothetical protein